MAVGAGVAVTGGVKRLPPVGLMLFSVADGVVDVVGGVVLEGPPGPLPPQAVNAPIETTAAMPRLAATRRPSRPFLIASPICAAGMLRMTWTECSVRNRQVKG
jgi:hypothetical protein